VGHNERCSSLPLTNTTFPAVSRPLIPLTTLEVLLRENMAFARVEERMWCVSLVVGAATPGAAVEEAETLLVPSIEGTGLQG
jgi:hypothetical protein